MAWNCNRIESQQLTTTLPVNKLFSFKKMWMDFHISWYFPEPSFFKLVLRHFCALWWTMKDIVRTYSRHTLLFENNFRPFDSSFWTITMWMCPHIWTPQIALCLFTNHNTHQTIAFRLPVDIGCDPGRFARCVRKRLSSSLSPLISLTTCKPIRNTRRT